VPLKKERGLVKVIAPLEVDVRFVKSAQKQISTFISHSSENNDEARYYEALLTDAGFTVFQYSHGLHLGEHIESVVSERIRKCHFFILVVSDYSLNSEWVQRELGLAVSLQKQKRNYRPIVIPLFAKDASWRKTGQRPKSFPTRDFDTGEGREGFSLDIRGLDKHASPKADADDILISFMKPSLAVTRLDFDNEATFDDTRVFCLYADLFPAVEQDDPKDIVRWVFDSDVGKKRSVRLSDREKISYKLDSRFFILCLANRAIGLGFFTYDYSSKLIYGNYIGVQECWRGGDIARALFNEILKVLEELFPRYQGVAFEVEKFRKERVEEIITSLEKSKSKIIDAQDDQNEIRKFLRVSWYHKLNCFFFFDRKAGEPLVCTSPCINPRGSREDWCAAEEDYWIMWYARPGSLDLSLSRARELWTKSVTSIYIEILAKSLVESCPENAHAYWEYAKSIVGKTLKESESKDINFSKFLDRHDSPLLARWRALGIDLPI
jgi:TIR domain